MQRINRIITNILSDNLVESKEFYTKLFDFSVNFDSDWFVHLVSKDMKLELGIVCRTSEIVPKEFQRNPQGFYLTFVVDDADKMFGIAKSDGIEIVSEPTDTFYGQRRLLLRDPSGTLVDISSPIKDSEA